MSNLIQRLQKTRDSVYRLSDKFGIVGHCDAVFIHRIHRSRLLLVPRPKLIEPSTAVLYRFQQSQTVEVNKDDKMLVGISRAGFENYDRIKSQPDGAIPLLSQYQRMVIPEPVEASYTLTLGADTDISIRSDYPEEDLGTYHRVTVTDINTGRISYSTKSKDSVIIARNIPLKVGIYNVSTTYNRVLPLINDPVKASTYVQDGHTLERTCRINGNAIDGSYTPLAVSWGTNQDYDYVYNGAICYINDKPHSILWVDTNSNLELSAILRPERSR